MPYSRDCASYRDPSGHVYLSGTRVFRTVTPIGSANYQAMRDAGLLDMLQAKQLIVTTKEVKAPNDSADIFKACAHLLEHQRIAHISYPYEWSFAQLKHAALHHLEVQLLCFDKGFVCSDATGYNIQFMGHHPIFIDILSFRPYQRGEFWHSYQQFCQQFLYPLLLKAKRDINFQDFYKGSLEGLDAKTLNAMLPLGKKLSPNLLMHLILPAKLAQRQIQKPEKMLRDAKKSRRLPAKSYHAFLVTLRDWIAGLNTAKNKKTVWNQYEIEQTYNSDELQHKQAFVTEFVSKTKPKKLFDLGCNTGTYSLLAAQNGAEYVVGFDFDADTIDIAYDRARTVDNFLPLVMDASRPSPSQGWRETERKSFQSRADADALIALAFEHHLLIAKNIEMPDFIDWLLSIAKMGVVEFVPKSDSTVQKMLAMRADIFADYSQDNFEYLLSQSARIIKKQKISKEGRTLYWYER